MRVLVTGAAGYIGRSVIHELVTHGHQVRGLVRSDASAQTIRKLGAEVLHGDIENTSVLESGARNVNGVIHLAFTMNLSDFPGACAVDRAALQALAQGLGDAKKPLVTTSGTLFLPPGQIGTEDTEPDRDSFLAARVASEDLIKSISKDGLARGCVVRPGPVVHDVEDKGFLFMLGEISKKNTEAAYIDQGTSRWGSVHRSDLAVLYRLVLEQGSAGSIYHGTGEESIQMRSIMESIGSKLGVPAVSRSQAEVDKTHGFFAPIIGRDNPISSAKTQAELGWVPRQIGLLSDIESNYF